MRNVRGILIDPFACTVTEVEHDADNYRGIYDLLSHETMPVDTFELVHSKLLKPGDAIFVDENGLNKPCERFFLFAGYPQELAGKGLVLGSDEEGDTIASATSIDIIRTATAFLHRKRFGNDLTITNQPWERVDHA